MLYMEEMPAVSEFFKIAHYFIFLVVIFKFLISREKRFDLFILISLFYVFITSYSSYVNSVNVNKIIVSFVSFFSFVAALKLDISKNLDETLAVLSIVLSFYCLLNFVLILLYPEGLWVGWSDVRREPISLYLIGGSHNQMGAALLVSYITCRTFYNYNRTQKMKLLCRVLLLSSLLTLIIVGSKTSLVGFLLVLSYWLIKSDKLRKFSLVSLIIFYFVFQIFAVFLMSDLSSNRFISYFVEELLQKDLTFTGRANIWYASTFVIMNSPIIGYGYQDIDWFLLNIDAVSPHNFVYWLLLRGGLLALLGFIGLVLLNMKNLFNTEKCFQLFGLWVLFFMSIMEAYHFYLYLFLLAFIYYTSYYLPKENQVRELV